jgi:hypothetical protein
VPVILINTLLYLVLEALTTSSKGTRKLLFTLET